MAKSLDDRIQAALGDNARAATVAELAEEVAALITTTIDEQQRQHAISVSLEADEATGEAAAAEAARLAARAKRLTAKKAALEARREEILQSDRQRARAEQQAAAKATRDALAEELASEWPALVGQLANMLARLAISDRECAAFRLESAEVVARGCTGMYFHPTLTGLRMSSLKELRLPKFHASEWDVGFTRLAAARGSGSCPCQ